MYYGITIYEIGNSICGDGIKVYESFMLVCKEDMSGNLIMRISKINYFTKFLF